MNIFVKTKSGKTLTLKVKPEDNVEDVKKQIYALIGIPVLNQRLIIQYGNTPKQIDDFEKLSDYEIKEGSTMRFIVKPNCHESMEKYRVIGQRIDFINLNM